MLHCDEHLDVIFLTVCILAVGQNWPYLQYFWKNSICLMTWPAALGICKLSPASSLVAVSPVCYGGMWPAVGPLMGREPSNHKTCCRKGRRAQTAGVRGLQQDFGLLPSPDSPGSRRQAASLTKQLVFWCHQCSCLWMLAKAEAWLPKVEAITHQEYQLLK